MSGTTTCCTLLKTVFSPMIPVSHDNIYVCVEEVWLQGFLAERLSAFLFA